MATTEVIIEPLVIGRLRIPAENVEEWQRIGEQIHDFIVAGKAIPKELTLRACILEGMDPAHAEWIAEHGEIGECGDTRER